MSVFLQQFKQSGRDWLLLDDLKEKSVFA